jgi:cell division septation protein DedD
MTSPEQQFEFFDAVSRPIAPTRRHMIAPVRLQIRPDQAMVAGVASLIGVAVIFAFGVERGKQLVRTERSILARRPVELPELPVPVAPATAVKTKSSTTSPAIKPPKKLASSPAKNTVKTEKAGAGSTSRYAVQLVSFSTPQLAKRELERLQARGERVFLVMRQGVTVVCAGPFPSKANAAEKLTNFKPRYQDCFIKTL